MFSTPATTLPPRRPSQTTMLPYRDETGAVRYAPAPSSTRNAYRYPSSTTAYDSDGEPLLSSSTLRSDLDEDALLRFTATGRPIPAFKAVARENYATDNFTVPQLLPRQYTDDSIIPAIITNVIPSPVFSPPHETKKRRKSLVKVLTGERSLEKKYAAEGEKKGITKVVFMPRREYLKWFARDEKGEYCGSEPYRQWTEEELNTTFAQYRPPKVENKGFVHYMLHGPQQSSRM